MSPTPRVTIARVTASPLSLDEHVSAVAGPARGAIATFVGVVRDHDPSVEGEVTQLDYSCHPDAQAVLERIAAGVTGSEFSGSDSANSPTPGEDISVAVSHRIGMLNVGDAAIVAAVSSAHRAQAIDSCRELVERIKAELPVWKREILADGSHTWVGVS